MLSLAVQVLLQPAAKHRGHLETLETGQIVKALSKHSMQKSSKMAWHLMGTSNHEIESPSAIPLDVADASAFLPMQLPAGRKKHL